MSGLLAEAPRRRAAPVAAVAPRVAPPTRSGVVVCRMRGGRDEPDLAARVARVARTLAPGDLIAVRAPAMVEAPHGRDGARLRSLACRFAPEDWTTLIWHGPALPEGAPASPPSRIADVRGLPAPLPLVAGAAAVGALDPGEPLVHVGDAPPILLLGLLEERVVLDGVAWEGPVVVARLRRSRHATAGAG